MSDVKRDIDQNLLQLIISLQAGAMQQMGKVASPFTGKVERDLSAAKYSIDVLDMLDKKMAGNMTDEEDKLIKHVLAELRLNYVDEKKKPDPEPVSEPEKPASETDETAE